MAEKIVSPGVFTNEKDLSFLPSGIAAIGAAIIGPTLKGPAFVPTQVANFDEFIAMFGGLSETTYVPYTVKSYLKTAATVTIIRVLQEGGYATGVINILRTPVLTTAATTYTVALIASNGADTGSTRANLPSTALANYTKLIVATGSGDITSSLGSLTWFSASTALTVTGSVFISSSTTVTYYAALFPSASITLNSASSTTYTATFNTWPSTTTTTQLVGTIASTTAVGVSTGVDYLKSTLPASAAYTTVFPVTLSGSLITAQSVSASVDSTSKNNFATVLGTAVTGNKKGHLYNYFQNSIVSTDLITFESSSNTTGLNLSGSNGGYNNASTPWITSQLIPGQSTPQLFKIHNLADGTLTNQDLKISIINTVLPGGDPGSDYGNFTILVREYADTDQRSTVLETYTGLNLDPDSPSYIARRIGDKSYTVSDLGVVTPTGDYRNISKYIRVEVETAVKAKATPATYKPFGIEGYVLPVSSSYLTPHVAYQTTAPQINSAYNKKAYYGFRFDGGSGTDNENYLSPLPANATTDTTVFNLDTCFIHPSASKQNTSSTFSGGSSISGSTFSGLDISTFLKFTIALQGGFDGMDPAIALNVGSAITATNVFGMNCAAASSAGSVAYIKALNVISNSDEYDVNMIVTPGITIANHASVVNKAIEVAEDRGDTFVVADIVVQGSTIATAIGTVADSGIDSSYVAAYWPWVKIIDTDRNKPVWVPPSVIVPRVIGFNDSVAFEWFAPAGLNRGGVSEAIDIESKLTQSDRDDLYTNRINPIATFPNQGVCIWGQKTLQTKPSALDRINVRRLLITLKKYIASSSRYLVFENNTTSTRQRFLNIVNPYLETVKARQGLYAFRVVMDETNNPPETIDRNIMYGQIFLQPAKSAEFIVLDFNILPTGASFENA